MVDFLKQRRRVVLQCDKPAAVYTSVKRGHDVWTWCVKCKTVGYEMVCKGLVYITAA